MNIPLPIPVRNLFRTVKNYSETVSLYADAPPIPLGRDLGGYPLEVSIYWMNARLQVHVSIGPQGMTVQAARDAGMQKFGKVELDEHATTRDVWLMARALALVLIGSDAEVTQVTAALGGAKSYPLESWMRPDGRGQCPTCRHPMPYRPAFPVNAIRRCHACGSVMIHREGRLDVLEGDPK